MLLLKIVLGSCREQGKAIFSVIPQNETKKNQQEMTEIESIRKVFEVRMKQFITRDCLECIELSLSSALCESEYIHNTIIVKSLYWSLLFQSLLYSAVKALTSG